MAHNDAAIGFVMATYSSMPFNADVMAVSRLHKPGARHRHTQHFRLSGAGEYMCRAARALCPVRVRVRVRALMCVCGKFKWFG